MKPLEKLDLNEWSATGIVDNEPSFTDTGESGEPLNLVRFSLLVTERVGGERVSLRKQVKCIGGQFSFLRENLRRGSSVAISGSLRQFEVETGKYVEVCYARKVMVRD
jgi:single-stranded DNA-binding protein